MSSERKLISHRFYFKPCPMCLRTPFVDLKAYFPMDPETMKETIDAMRKYGEDYFNGHFEAHAEQISDAEWCVDCIESNGGHPRCDEPDCTCSCQL